MLLILISAHLFEASAAYRCQVNSYPGARWQHLLVGEKINGDSQQGLRVSIAGRVVLDGIDGLKTATYQFESFCLGICRPSVVRRKGKATDDVDNRLEKIDS